MFRLSDEASKIIKGLLIVRLLATYLSTRWWITGLRSHILGQVRDVSTILKSRTFLLLGGMAAIGLIAIADRSMANGIPLALLYLAPIVPMSTVLRRSQIVLLGLFCTGVAELADAFPWTIAQGIPRDVLYFFVYTTAGLYVSEVVSRRRAEINHVNALEAEIDARRAVEEQLSLVVANSSIAIVTTDEQGVILHANEAAERIYSGDEVPPATGLQGTMLVNLMPSLARVQIRKEGWEHLRTMMQCQGFRATKEPFMADVWFSTYMTSGGGRLTAMIVDSSLEIRDREEANLEQVLVGSRLAIGAVSHEIRNICAAISVVHQNLGGAGSAQPAEDLVALRQLVGALERIASVELSLVKRQASRLRLDSFLRDLYIIVQPSLREAGVTLEWQVDSNLPDVWADHQSLLQVFLNLVRNAETAMQGTECPRLAIRARACPDRVQISVSDNGPGVRFPDQLFQPFRPRQGAPGDQSGLGLYLSRAMMGSFHGDLRYSPEGSGATFVVEMAAAEASA
jgi:signal transduction histidine kinase